MTLFERSAKELQEGLHNGELTITQLTQEAYDRIEKLDGDVQAFLALNKEQALAQAAEMDYRKKKTVFLDESEWVSYPDPISQPLFRRRYTTVYQTAGLLPKNV